MTKTGSRWFRSVEMAFVAVAGGLLGCGDAGNDEARARANCEQLRERVVDLRMASVAADREQHRAAIRHALDLSSDSPGFVARCVETMSAAQVACGIGARDAEALAACR